MKTKNNLTTGILLGIGVIVLPLILMGTTYTTEKQNKFEFHITQGDNINDGYILNTENGDCWYVEGGPRNFTKVKLKEVIK